ncbi:hypothetical protein IQ268_09190 [Oculatella sp. LEGE 06141]|uniref:hypothetical protein n=1 Tax=Oculatella sp. LEGE 06141 TaxID=1828648 RepID=UPI00187E8208|nr:hypothetical protein [Oculatella sp. LEGE 06141]MBE9178733.1 hypothetical protein [Oculatella sp. LEGE 06141]
MEIKELLIERLKQILARSPEVFQHINEVNISSDLRELILEIKPSTAATNAVAKHVEDITQQCISLAPFEQIVLKFYAPVRTDVALEVADITELHPSTMEPILGPIDDQHQQEQVLFCSCCRSLINYLVKEASVFIISTTGIYLEVNIHQGTISMIPDEYMLGKRLDEVLPIATAQLIMEAIDRVYDSGQPEQIEYPIKSFRYCTELIPVPNENRVLAIVKRIKR